MIIDKNFENFNLKGGVDLRKLKKKIKLSNGQNAINSSSIYTSRT